MQHNINNNCFDFLRVFLALNIVFDHIYVLSQNEKLYFFNLISDSSLAVKGFFVMSGFLVAKSYTNSKNISNYFIKRAKRILPAYLVVICLAAIFLSSISKYSLVDYFTNFDVLKYIGWNAVFMNFIHPCLPGVFDNNIMCAVNGALWTLKIEEGFYIILPFLFWLFHKSKNPILILFILYIFSIIYWEMFQNYWQKPLLAKQLPGYLAYFSVGILGFLKFDLLMKYKLKLGIIAVVLCVILFNFQFPFDFIFPLAFSMLILVIAYSLPFLNNFGKHGDFTYGIYIYHFPLIQIFKYYDLFEKYNPMLMAILLLFLTFICSLFSWFVIEKRFLDRYKIKPEISYAN